MIQFWKQAHVALLQISEPGQSPAPHQHRLAIGIDLGTTHSLVATVRSGNAQVLPDEAGRVLLPSVVRYLANGQVQVGVDALAHQLDDAANTIASAKRLIGLSFEESREQGGLLYAMQPATDDTGAGAALQTVQGPVTPLEVSSQILRVLRQRAEDTLGGELVGAVITVPAYFDDAQRQATRDAARLAGLNVLRLINEPTAAALAYGLDKGLDNSADKRLYAVFDLGGGTFDLSILKLTRGVFEVMATRGDTRLGGDDFDALIVQEIIRQNTTNTLSREDRHRLHKEARRVRETLSAQPQVTFQTTLADGHTLQHTFTREQFNTWAQPLVQRTLDCTAQALKDAGIASGQISGVIMVGGATRMPVVRRAVQTFFGQPPLTDLDPDQVVALGAAKQADLLAGNRTSHEGADPDWTLLDVTPLSLGLETMGGLVERIIPRNSTLPVARAQEFTTFKDGQTAMSLHVVQGERELVSECRSLARFELRNLPPMTAGAARIRVTFAVDADGLLEVTALETRSKVQAQITVKPSYGLSDEEVAAMLAAGMNSSDTDARERMRREAQLELQRLVESVVAALASDADLLESNELAAIQGSLAQAQLQLQTPQANQDADALRNATRQLTAATEDFAARRMDASIRAALSGKSLNELG